MPTTTPQKLRGCSCRSLRSITHLSTSSVCRVLIDFRGKLCAWMSWLLGAVRAQLVMVCVFVARFLVHADALSFIYGPSCVHQLCQPPFVGKAPAVHSSTRLTWITTSMCQLLLSSSSHKLTNEPRCFAEYGHHAWAWTSGWWMLLAVLSISSLWLMLRPLRSRELLCISQFRQPPTVCNVAIASSVSCTSLASSCALGSVLVLLSP